MEPLAPWRVWVQVVVVGSALAFIAWRGSAFLRIVGLGIAALIGYGMVQDQVSVRLCPEYFTVGHPPIEGLENPTLLGIAWGFLGAWWGGLILGLVLTVAARAGRGKPREPGELIRPVGVLLVGVAAVTLCCGVSAWYNAAMANVSLGEPWASAIPPERQRWFLIVACAHFGSYLSAVMGGVLLCAWTVSQRRACE